MNRASLFAFLVCTLLTCAHATPWHTSLYLNNGNIWSKRIPITIRNDTDTAIAGQPLAVAISPGEGQADLVGISPALLRVCDIAGGELLFAIRGPDGKPLASGGIPAGATLIIPAECPAKSSATAYIYLDNPNAWPLPDFLDAAVKPTASAAAGNIEVFTAYQAGDGNDWPAAIEGHRVAVRALNTGQSPLAGLMAIDGRALEGYFVARQLPAGFSIGAGTSAVPTIQIGDTLLFQATVAADTLQTWHVYPSPPIPADTAYRQLLESPVNLAKNPSFEDNAAGRAPAAWSGSQATNRQGIEVGVAATGRLGQRCARIHVPASANPSWIG